MLFFNYYCVVLVPPPPVCCVSPYFFVACLLCCFTSATAFLYVTVSYDHLNTHTLPTIPACWFSCIAALADAGDRKKGGGHIPFRDSKLTRILQVQRGRGDYFGMEGLILWKMSFPLMCFRTQTAAVYSSCIFSQPHVPRTPWAVPPAPGS